jgi:hypothetical protein
MSTGGTDQNFKFKSSLVAAIITKCFGLALMWVSIDLFLGGWISLSWHKLPYLVLLLPFGLFFLGAGAAFLLNTYQIEILDGQLRFRRFFTWESAPLDSITSFRQLPAPGLYMRVDHDGKRYRMLFSPEDYKMQPYPLPIIGFLREVCQSNEQSQPRQPDT